MNSPSLHLSVEVVSWHDMIAINFQEENPSSERLYQSSPRWPNKLAVGLDLYPFNFGRLAPPVTFKNFISPPRTSVCSRRWTNIKKKRGGWKGREIPAFEAQEKPSA